MRTLLWKVGKYYNYHILQNLFFSVHTTYWCFETIYGWYEVEKAGEKITLCALNHNAEGWAISTLVAYLSMNRFYWFIFNMSNWPSFCTCNTKCSSRSVGKTWFTRFTYCQHMFTLTFLSWIQTDWEIFTALFCKFLIVNINDLSLAAKHMPSINRKSSPRPSSICLFSHLDLSDAFAGLLNNNKKLTI